MLQNVVFGLLPNAWWKDPKSNQYSITFIIQMEYECFRMKRIDAVIENLFNWYSKLQKFTYTNTFYLLIVKSVIDSWLKLNDFFERIEWSIVCYFLFILWLNIIHSHLSISAHSFRLFNVFSIEIAELRRKWKYGSVGHLKAIITSDARISLCHHILTHTNAHTRTLPNERYYKTKTLIVNVKLIRTCVF